jgi:hypothetical protein
MPDGEPISTTFLSGLVMVWRKMSTALTPHGQKRCTTIGALRAAFSGDEGLIPRFGAKFPPFTFKTVEHSRSFPPIYKRWMEEGRSGADFSGHEPPIPRIGADFLHGSSKSVEVGPKLPRNS